MITKNIFILLATVMLLSSHAEAVDNMHRVIPGGGFSIPVGDYAKTNDAPSAGFAKLGMNAGVEYDLMFGESGFGWSSSFNYMANDYESDHFSRGLNVVLQESGAYSSYALLTGFKYEKKISDNFSLFAVAQGGGCLSRGPFLNGFLDTGGDELNFVEFQMGDDKTAGFSIGLGMIANETTTVILRYFNLGSPVFSTNATYQLAGVNQTTRIEWTQPVSMITLSIGYAIDLGL